ncbi:unnamed protein product [Allacma fusca]|uniref:Uncharacterized protein n=1 Tax=Allacma fusca TaxID=39272 RepID=A0A8J2PE49_9HEXA|nr:unnamed protein product [Allacma fusca]
MPLSGQLEKSMTRTSGAATNGQASDNSDPVQVANTISSVTDTVFSAIESVLNATIGQIQPRKLFPIPLVSLGVNKAFTSNQAQGLGGKSQNKKIDSINSETSIAKGKGSRTLSQTNDESLSSEYADIPSNSKSNVESQDDTIPEAKLEQLTDPVESDNENSTNYITSNELSSESEESQEVPIPWLKDIKGRPHQSDKHRKLDMLNETLDPYKKFNSDDLYDFPELVPTDGNVSDLKWRESHWEDKTKELGRDGFNVTEGNWTKGFRELGHWEGPNKTEGTWLEEGLYKGMWSMTKHLGRSLIEIFWTKQFDAQINITMGGNDTSTFVNGNWSEGNSTKEVGIDEPDGFIPHEDIHP